MPSEPRMRKPGSGTLTPRPWKLPWAGYGTNAEPSAHKTPYTDDTSPWRQGSSDGLSLTGPRAFSRWRSDTGAAEHEDEDGRGRARAVAWPADRQMGEAKAWNGLAEHSHRWVQIFHPEALRCRKLLRRRCGMEWAGQYEEHVNQREEHGSGPLVGPPRPICP